MSPAPPASPLGCLPLAAFLIPPLVGTTLWLSNMDRVPYEDALPVIALMFGLGLLALAVLRLILRDWVRAGLILLIAAIYILYGKPAAAALTGAPWLRALLLLLAALVAIMLARRVPRDRAALLD